MVVEGAREGEWKVHMMQRGVGRHRLAEDVTVGLHAVPLPVSNEEVNMGLSTAGTWVLCSCVPLLSARLGD